jgi:prepilin-type N-terminal cleavage/methylation domain-containing protein
VNVKGFTLFELLIVIGLIGILTAAGAFFLGRGRSTELLKSARAQFAQDIVRARSWTKSYSYNYQIVITTATNTYEIKPVSTTATGLPSISKTLPTGTKFITVPISSIVYYAPLGRLEVSNEQYKLGLTNSTATTGLRANVDLVGVTGSVIARALKE